MVMKIIFLSLLIWGQMKGLGWACCSPQQTQHFYIMQEAWHTGIVLDVNTIPDTLIPLANLRGNSKYIEIGWGDEAFYQTYKIKLRLVFKAVLVPSQSVLRVRGLWSNPESFYGTHTSLFRIECSPEQYHNLLEFISQSFVTDPEGQVMLSGYKEHNRNFYLSQRSYHLFRTCNTWVALALSESSFDIRYSMVLTRRQLVRQLRRIDAFCIE